MLFNANGNLSANAKLTLMLIQANVSDNASRNTNTYATDTVGSV